MNPFDWIESHSGAVTAFSAFVSAFFAGSIYKVEKGRDLAPNQIHGWILGVAFPQYVPEFQDTRNIFRLEFVFVNGSELPIYNLKVKVFCSSAFSDGNLNFPRKKKIYELTESMMHGGEGHFKTKFPIRPDQILEEDLKKYLLNYHDYKEGDSPVIEKLASSLGVEISFRDSGGNFWLRKRSGKLKRQRFKEILFSNL